MIGRRLERQTRRRKGRQPTSNSSKREISVKQNYIYNRINTTARHHCIDDQNDINQDDTRGTAATAAGSDDGHGIRFCCLLSHLYEAQYWSVANTGHYCGPSSRSTLDDGFFLFDNNKKARNIYSTAQDVNQMRTHTHTLTHIYTAI